MTETFHRLIRENAEAPDPEREEVLAFLSAQRNLVPFGVFYGSNDQQAIDRRLNQAIDDIEAGGEVPSGAKFAAMRRIVTEATVAGDEQRDARVTARIQDAAPPDVDTELAGVYDRLWKEQGRVESAQRTLDYARRRQTNADVDRLAQSVAIAQARADRVARELRPYEAEYRRRGGWSRYFLVVTSGQGHIHSSMRCSTCRPTTQYQWQPHMSGKTESDAVGEYGSDMCTVCFPSAPADPRYAAGSWTQRQRDEARATRQAEKDAKAQAAAAKAVTAPDGGTLKVPDGWVANSREVKTEIAAERLLVETVADRRTRLAPARLAEDLASFENTRTTSSDPGLIKWAEQMTRARRREAEAAEVAEGMLVEALARKRGISEAELRAALEPKFAKKVKNSGY